MRLNIHNHRDKETFKFSGVCLMFCILQFTVFGISNKNPLFVTLQ